MVSDDGEPGYSAGSAVAKGDVADVFNVISEAIDPKGLHAGGKVISRDVCR